MKVRVKRGQLAYFRSKARASEDEIAAYLVGTMDSPERVTIKHILIAGPDDCTEQSPSEVSFSTEFFEKVRSFADEKGLIIVGDIHSHPNWWPVKSPTDHESQLRESLRLCGVCGVMCPKTCVYFWTPESSLPATIEYY